MDGTQDDRMLRLVAEAIRVLRQAKGWGQQELSTATGIHVVTISRHENEHTDISLTTAVRYAKALGVSLNELVNSGDPNDVPALFRVEPVFVLDPLKVRTVLDAKRAAQLRPLILPKSLAVGCIVRPTDQVVPAETWRSTMQEVARKTEALGEKVAVPWKSESS